MISFTALNKISMVGLVFYTGLLLALVLVPLSNRLAVWLGIVDIPNERKVHRQSIPRLGGVAVAIALFATLYLFLRDNQLCEAYLLGAGLITFTGLLDDKYRISPRLKFVGQILAVAIFIKVSGIRLQGLGNLLGPGEIHFGPAALPITIFCMVGVINALNLSDGLDGLAAGITAIALLYFALFALQQRDWFWLTMIAAFLGTVLGFLRHNSYPATLFMGDTGSLLLGYSLAAISVGLAHSHGPTNGIEPATIFIILALPIVDTLLVMGRRFVKGKHPFHPDKTHLHHRLMDLGLSHASVVPMIYGSCALLGLLAWLTRAWAGWQQFYLATGLIILGYLLLALMERRQVDIGARLYRGRRLRRLWKYRLVRLSGRSVPWVGGLLPILLFLPLLCLWQVPQSMGLVVVGSLLFVSLLFPWRGGRKQMGLAHGVLFAACFMLLIFYHFHPKVSTPILVYLNIISVTGLLWVAFRVVFKRRDQILLPTGFELLLIIVSWFVPVVLADSLNFSTEARHRLTMICFQAIPLLGVIKLSLRRHARRNKQLALGFVTVFLLLSIVIIRDVPNLLHG